MARSASAALVALVLLTGCASNRVGIGHGSGVRPIPSTSSVTAPSGSTVTALSSSAATTPAASAGGATPCPQSDPTQVAACLHGVLSNYWSAQLNNVLDEPIVLDPAASQVPSQCLSGLEGGTAFTCKSDLTLYVTHDLLTLIARYFHGVDRALALASVAGHEIGHVLQYTLHQPEIERKHQSDATSQVIEQQADCLSGVWAGQAAQQHTLDADRFVTDAVNLITLVSSNPEIATHGSPSQRRAAIERGLAGGSAGVCNLVTFH